MIATDSVATWNERKDIADSKELGGWSVEHHPGGMFLIQPGLYYGSSGKAPKTRGVPTSVIKDYEETFRQAFTEMVQTKNLAKGDVRVPQRMFVGIKYALHRRNLRLLGQWIEFVDEDGRKGKVIKFDWTTKRRPFPVIEPVPGIHDYIETFPPAGDAAIESFPYSKDIGGLLQRETLRQLYDGQPDWIRMIEPTELEIS